MTVDRHRAEAAVRELLTALGEDPSREGLSDTPRRVVALYEEMFAGLGHDPGLHLSTVFAADHDELVMVKDISFASMCEHHLVPFIGTADVAYIPGHDGMVTGLSKLVRLVEGFAHRPQVQERMTKQVADTLMEALSPRGVLVVLQAEHLCMSIRGVRKPGTTTVTSAVRGLFRERPATRAEALGLMGRR
ncbi:MAG: GTP cyclohydrolase I FolE [Actinomycetota bacterium]|nr:GTP cyclohydrolase I FolE [Actinomycetota bacterium]